MARRPSSGNLSDPYGWRWHPIWGDRRFHSGADIGWSEGRTLVAPSNGTIVAYGWQGGWGKRLDFLGDDGVLHYLAHTADLWVAVNTRVTEGTPIAEMGATGDVTGVHLHWETRPAGGSTIDPEEWLRNATPTPTAGGKDQLIESEEDDDNMAKNSGFYYTNPATGDVTYLMLNTVSGWWHEFTNAESAYNTSISVALGTGDFAPITPSHAVVLKTSCERVLNQTVTVELAPADATQAD